MQVSVNPSRAISKKLCKSPDGTTVKGFTVDDTECTYSTAKRADAAQGRALMSLPGKTVRAGVPPYDSNLLNPRPEIQAYAKEYFTTQSVRVSVPVTSGAATPLTRVSFSFAVDNAKQILAGKVLCDARLEPFVDTHDPRSVRCDVDAKTKTVTVTFLNEDSMGGVVLVNLGLKAKRSGLLSIDAPIQVQADGTILSDVVRFQVRFMCVLGCILHAGALSLFINRSTPLRLHRRWRRPARRATACARPTTARWATPTASAARLPTPPTAARRPRRAGRTRPEACACAALYEVMEGRRHVLSLDRPGLHLLFMLSVCLFCACMYFCACVFVMSPAVSHKAMKQELSPRCKVSAHLA